MDVRNLRENHPKLISHMESAGYNKHYVSLFKSEVRNILNFADSGRIHNYEDAYQLYKMSELSPGSVVGKGTMIAAIEKFDLYGLYPNGSIKQTYTPKGAYHALCPEYKAIADYFSKEHKNAENVIHLY